MVDIQQLTKRCNQTSFSFVKVRSIHSLMCILHVVRDETEIVFIGVQHPD